MALGYIVQELTRLWMRRRCAVLAVVVVDSWWKTKRVNPLSKQTTVLCNTAMDDLQPAPPSCNPTSKQNRRSSDSLVCTRVSLLSNRRPDQSTSGLHRQTVISTLSLPVLNQPGQLCSQLAGNSSANVSQIIVTPPPPSSPASSTDHLIWGDNGCLPRMSSLPARGEDDPYTCTFVHVQAETLDEHEPVGAILFCKRRLLGPYFRLMGLIGIRPLFDEHSHRGSRWTTTKRVFNALYTLLLILLLFNGRLLHTLSCYQEPWQSTTSAADQQQNGAILCENSPVEIKKVVATDDGESNAWNLMTETQPVSKLQFRYVSSSTVQRDDKQPEVKDALVGSKNGQTVSSVDNRTANQTLDLPAVQFASCGSIFTGHLLPNLLWLLAYMCTVYLMRARQVENTEYLLERCFLSCNRSSGWFRAHRQLLRRLRTHLMMAGLATAGAGVSLMLQLTFQSPHFDLINWLWTRLFQRSLNGRELCWLAWTTAVSGLLTEMAAALIIATYGIYCEFNIRYLLSLETSVRERRIDLQVSSFEWRTSEARTTREESTRRKQLTGQVCRAIRSAIWRHHRRAQFVREF